jgi:hypothetical protein
VRSNPTFYTAINEIDFTFRFPRFDNILPALKVTCRAVDR